MSSGNSIREVSLSDSSLASYAELFYASFENSVLNFEYLDWLYRRNPSGNPVGFDFVELDKPVAHYVTVPIKAFWDGKFRKGLLSLNTATRPSHQGKGIFTRLASETYSLAANKGYEFVVGVANENSTSGFVKKLGFHNLGSLGVFLGLGQVELRKRDSKDFDFFRVWELNEVLWRMHNPNRNYQVKKNESSFTIVSRERRVLQVQMGIIESQNLDHESFEFVSNQNYLPKVFLGTKESIKFSGLFLNLPLSLRPSPLNLIFKPLVQGSLPKRISFWPLDFDAF